MPGVASFLRGQLLQSVPLPTTDLSGRTVLITGANSGLGLDCAKHLHRLNCSHILLACRTLEKAEAAKRDILSSSSNFPSQSSPLSPSSSSSQSKSRSTSHPKISCYALDLTSFPSILSLATHLTATLPRLDALILNAGVDLHTWSLSSAGYETTLTVNVISTFALALLLLPKLRASAAEYEIMPRICVVGSAVHFWADKGSLTGIPPGSGDGKGDTVGVLKKLSEERWSVTQGHAPMKGEARYFLSKLLVMMCVVQLADQITSESAPSASSRNPPQPFVLVTNTAPGYCQTSLFRHDESAAVKASLKAIGRPSEVGARCLVHGGCEVGREGHGMYLSESRVKRMWGWVLGEEGREIGVRVWGEVVQIVEGMKLKGGGGDEGLNG